MGGEHLQGRLWLASTFKVVSGWRAHSRSSLAGEHIQGRLWVASTFKVDLQNASEEKVAPTSALLAPKIFCTRLA